MALEVQMPPAALERAVPLEPAEQDLSARTVFRAADRPPVAGAIDWTSGAEGVAALVVASLEESAP